MKCEFINAVLPSPEILFLDEPTIGLDIIAKQKIREFIKKMNKQGTTIILTTHDISDVEELCKRVMIIDHGLLIYDNNINHLKKEYAKYKDLEVDFNKLNKNISVPNSELIYQKGLRAVLRINIKKTSISKVINELLKNYEIRDLNIKEQKIEGVIKEIYEKGL